MTQTMTALPKYESYKDSEIDWIGDIPEHWELKPFRSLFHFRNEKNDPIKTENILSLSIANGVTEYTEEGRGGNKRKDDLTAYKLAYPGDIVLNSMNVIVGAVGLSRYFGAISPVYYALYIRSKNSNLYYCERAFLDESFQKGLLRHGKGIMMKLSGTGKLNTIRMKVSTNDLKKIYFPFPPKEEQDKIVEFLNEKTAQIDRAIEIKEKQIALLKERKQIIIQNAVTKGLDPNVPMKDSGVDWIGDIPAHWEVKPGMKALHEKKDSNKGMKESKVLSLSYGKIIIKPKEKLVGLVPESFETYQIATPHDIIIRCTDLQNDQTSLRTGLVQDKGIITSAYLNLNVKEPHDPEFIHYFLHFLDITKVLYKFGSGLRQNLSWVDFKRMPMVIVPNNEQQEIVKYIEAKSAEIKSAKDLLCQQIDKLKEYKASLINSAVTGKIKVI